MSSSDKSEALENWQTGILRIGSMQGSNIHNHPLHSDSKIPAKVDSDIRKAVVANPHLKTADIVVGKLFEQVVQV